MFFVWSLKFNREERTLSSCCAQTEGAIRLWQINKLALFCLRQFAKPCLQQTRKQTEQTKCLTVKKFVCLFACRSLILPWEEKAHKVWEHFTLFTDLKKRVHFTLNHLQISSMPKRYTFINKKNQRKIFPLGGKNTRVSRDALRRQIDHLIIVYFRRLPAVKVSWRERMVPVMMA